MVFVCYCASKSICADARLRIGSQKLYCMSFERCMQLTSTKNVGVRAIRHCCSLLIWKMHKNVSDTMENERGSFRKLDYIIHLPPTQMHYKLVYYLRDLAPSYTQPTHTHTPRSSMLVASACTRITDG